MGNRQRPTESDSPDQGTLLVGLNTQIRKLDAKITRLIEEKRVLEEARNHILSLSNASAKDLEDKQRQSDASSWPSMHTSHPSPATPIRKRPSSLRQQATIRSALERDQSPSPPASSGLLPSEDFEAGFEDGDGELQIPREETGSPSSISSRPSTSPSSIPTSPGGMATADQGTTGKRVTKRKRRENAAKAREVRKKRLDEAATSTMR